ncbi:unnamed protein product [Mytilus edulis]|uniref:Uncharacterized protein n=1 Tax=Mytilus edulis TaxID=6550 RepID=A0A8S3T0T4_MYTED|nr:unnamed protein product [Mytilus edulis]
MFSLKSDFEKDPLKIYCNQLWNAGSGNTMRYKTPSCVLLDRNKELTTFGYDAESEFAAICLNGYQKDYYFFRGFNTKNITVDTTLMDETGKSLFASHVCKMFIKAFVDHLMKFLDRKRTSIQKCDIIWVIPVSVDLTDTSKQLLRSCAEQEGIPSDHLMFVTETEAAFIYCHHSLGREHYQHLKDVTEYMVVNLGDIVRFNMTCSFVDIKVLKKDGTQVIDKYRTADNGCGGSLVYETFLKNLVRIFGSQFMTSLQKEQPSVLLDIERELEFKRDFKGNHSGKINFSIPFDPINSFCKKYLGEDLSEVICSSIYGNDITLISNKMRINSDLFCKCFKPTIDNIINLMENVFADYKDSHEVSAIVMVGEFSKYNLVQEAVRQMFPKKDIIIPTYPELAEMLGAVVCGHQPCQYKQMSQSQARK